MTSQINPSVLVAETPLSRQFPTLVLFGRGADGKPRAAWFEAADDEAAASAAQTMQLRTLSLVDDEQRMFAAKLARGRLLQSGRALVPFVKHDLYARLIAMAGEEAGLHIAEVGQGEPLTNPGRSGGTAIMEAERPVPPCMTDARNEAGPDRPRGEGDAAQTGAAAAPPVKPRPGDRTFVGRPRPRDRDEIGLGSLVLAHEGVDDGWWEAEVIGINGSVFSLRWYDYPTEPTILRKAGELALLPPGEA